MPATPQIQSSEPQSGPAGTASCPSTAEAAPTAAPPANVPASGRHRGSCCRTRSWVIGSVILGSWPVTRGGRLSTNSRVRAGRSHIAQDIVRDVGTSAPALLPIFRSQLQAELLAAVLLHPDQQ